MSYSLSFAFIHCLCMRIRRGQWQSFTSHFSLIAVTMGLLTVLKKLKRKEKEIRILVLGLDNAGKTTMLKKLNGEDIDEISPTVGWALPSFCQMGLTLECCWAGSREVENFRQPLSFPLPQPPVNSIKFKVCIDKFESYSRFVRKEPSSGSQVVLYSYISALMVLDASIHVVLPNCCGYGSSRVAAVTVMQSEIGEGDGVGNDEVSLLMGNP